MMASKKTTKLLTEIPPQHKQSIRSLNRSTNQIPTRSQPLSKYPK